jgi:hypothetical protein
LGETALSPYIRQENSSFFTSKGFSSRAREENLDGKISEKSLDKNHLLAEAVYMGGRDAGEVPARCPPPLFNEQVIVNSEQVS